jgi:hypothetical protein
MTTTRQFKAAAALIALLAVLAQAQDSRSKSRDKASENRAGILLLAHGGKQQWNDEVNKIAAEVTRGVPVEVAFGMATKRNIQEAVDKLESRGVTEIVAVPLFVSSHSSIITSTAYLLGLRKEAPPELAVYARMDHSHGGEHANHAGDPNFDPTTPVKSQVPIRLTPALDSHAIVAEILLSRALTISRQPHQEVVVIVAHGPVSDAENAKWLAQMAALAQPMKKASSFQRIDYLTVRDDALEPIRSQATAELRSVVERASTQGHRVLIVPLLMSYGGIEEGIRKRLEGLNYTMCPQALLPDSRLARWVLLSAGMTPKN